ncbi:dynein axonemal assembly factor 6 [Sceloporus undulatus]|uniref:dynein axonemal assembly factor 6 n=1 Tax=Sceloporus undulatus TaxID=8520 RepID=UPI001C4C8163|nr:dynein axonemal assembly factor 6 [Sceloporus undulatus]
MVTRGCGGRRRGPGAMEPSVRALAALLSAPKDPEEDPEEAEAGGGPRGPPWARRAGPGDIGPSEASPSRAPGTSEAERSPGGSREIWSREEVPEGSDYEDAWDPREQPQYEILFKQQVGPEDMFLGLSRKDPSTACCEDMLIKIKLPDMKASDITLDIQEKVLDLRSPKKKLLLHLPHPVDTKRGRACFLQEKGILEVTLRMKRDFDFINFA